MWKAEIVIEFSLSTAWNARTAPDAFSMIRDIKDLGFGRVELNFTLTSKDIRDIISLKEKEALEITSLHNYCPVPEGISPGKASPDCYNISSLDEGERRKAIEATKVTIETAKRLNARFVILHLGRVEIEDGTRALAASLDNKAEYEYIRKKMTDGRRESASLNFKKTLMSVDELLGFAKRHNIILGAETRFYHREIPSLDEFEELFREFTDTALGYWHDVGHAQLFQNLGLAKHKDFLDRLSHRMVGMHIHDISGTDDHRAPLQGDFDFSLLKPYLKKKTMLVLEPHQPATGGEIKRGAEYLSKLFGDIL